jgi:hypothetical protein
LRKKAAEAEERVGYDSARNDKTRNAILPGRVCQTHQKYKQKKSRKETNEWLHH